MQKLIHELIPRAQDLLRAALAGVSDEEAVIARRVMNAVFANMRESGAAGLAGSDGRTGGR